MHSQSRLRAFRQLAALSTLLALVVIVLGAWVRLNAAGLGCPDWPGCYGHISAAQAARNLADVRTQFPQRPFEYAKAHKEMVHRYLAGGLGLLILTLAALAVSNRRHPEQPVALPLLLVGLVIFQGLLGMWTVTLLLKPLIVVLHLLGGLATASLLAWLAFAPSLRARVPTPPSLRGFAAAAVAVLVAQIALGGWTSSNYAALACPDFPTCQLSLWPEMDFKNAFILWRGLGIDYEGGILDHPARVAIHFTHRLGAIVTAIVLLSLCVAVVRAASSAQQRVLGWLLAVVLVAQLVLGPVMVLRGLPLDLASAHNAMAALLLVLLICLNAALRPERPTT